MDQEWLDAAVTKLGGWPQRKITVGLSRASLPKRGSWFAPSKALASDIAGVSDVHEVPPEDWARVGVEGTGGPVRGRAAVPGVPGARPGARHDGDDRLRRGRVLPPVVGCAELPGRGGRGPPQLPTAGTQSWCLLRVLGLS
jgi:hypothetical protein